MSKLNQNQKSEHAENTEKQLSKMFGNESHISISDLIGKSIYEIGNINKWTKAQEKSMYDFDEHLMHINSKTPIVEKNEVVGLFGLEYVQDKLDQ